MLRIILTLYSASNYYFKKYLDKEKQNLLFEFLQKADKFSELAGKCCIYWITFFAFYSGMCVIVNTVYSLLIDGHIVLRYFFPYRML